MLELLWDEPVGIEQIYSFFDEGEEAAFVKISIDPVDEEAIDIEEYEVLRTHRNKGFGKECIRYLLNDLNSTVKLLAKNSSVQKFWKLCGFEGDGVSICEISLIYRTNQ